MDTKKPKVSVVMSVFNGQKFLRCAIESVLSQTFTDFEFVIVNDGSLDESREIIVELAKKDERIKFIDRVDNKGLSYSLNEGILASVGTYVARMDSDDISLPTRLMEQVSFMDNNPSIGVCGAAAFIINECDDYCRTYFPPQSHEDAKIQMLFSSCFIHPSVIVRRYLLDELPFIYRPEYKNSQDYELWSRLIEVTFFHNLPLVLICYRKADGGISASVNGDGLNKRYPLISPVHNMFLKKIGICNGYRKSIIHFRLSLIHEMESSDFSSGEIKDYLVEIFRGNKGRGNYQETKLYLHLCKKFFTYFLVARRDKVINKEEFAGCFDIKLFLGFLVVAKDLLMRRTREAFPNRDARKFKRSLKTKIYLD